MLTERYVSDNLPSLLVPRERYRPFPTAADRAAWHALPETLRRAHIAAAERHRGREWPSLPATLFMEYRRTGNRSHYERIHFERRNALASLVIAACMEGTDRFLDDIVNGLWALCEESFWGVPAHNQACRFPDAPLPDTSERVFDLFAGETASLLAWTHYLLADALDGVSPVICDRMRREVRERLIDPYLARDDFWWMGLNSAQSPDAPRRVNNWNPWCNSNALVAALLLEEDRTRRSAVVGKALRSLDAFLATYHADGGCDEGPSYWGRAGGSLFDCLELLYSASGGQIDVYDEPLIAEIGRYLYRVFIGGENYFINFADGGARVDICADLVYRYGQRIGDENLMALGSSAHHLHRRTGRIPPLTGSLLRVLPALFHYAQIDAATIPPPYVRDVWLDGIEVMAAREQGGTDRGLYVAAKGGHNNESHNHNDVGQFLVFCDGEPLFIDVGVETYTARTFSPQRYEIWTMQSAYHNLPTVGGAQQAAGREFAAREVVWEADDSHAQLSLDIAAAYPSEAGVETWRRVVRLDRGEEPVVSIRENFRLTVPAEVVLSLMTPRIPDIQTPGLILLPGKATACLRYPETALEAEVEPIDVADSHLQAVWGERLFRILLRARGPVSTGDWWLECRACFRSRA